MSESSRVTKVLRWVLVGPAAVLASMAPHAFLSVVRIFRVYPPIGLDLLLADGVSGFLFVIVGTCVAPSYTRPVALVLLVLYVLLAGFGSVGLLVVEGAGSLVGLLLSVVGAGLGFVYAPHAVWHLYERED